MKFGLAGLLLIGCAGHSSAIPEGELQYDHMLTRRLHQALTLPKKLAKTDLRTRVTIKIQKDGEVTETKLMQSSGNADFDRLAMATVKKLTPLPPPPAGIAGEPIWLEVKSR